MRRATAPALLASALALAACDDPPADALTRCDEGLLVAVPVKTDILFVIDDSESMTEEQALVQEQLAVFLDTLDHAPVPIDYRIGVTNTSVAGFGGETVYTSGPNDGLSFPAGRVLAVDPSTRAYDYLSAKRFVDAGSPTRVADFESNVLVGISGTGKEQGFSAARLALEESVAGGANEGFLRPGARLAVIFVSDEDDCSSPAGTFTSNSACRDPAQKPDLDPIDGFVSFLQGPIAGEQRDVVVAAIVGLRVDTLAPSCGYSPNPWCDDPVTATTCTTAYDRADRYAALLDALGATPTATPTIRDSICDASFAGSLDAIAQLIAPDEMPLEGAPADWRMLAVSVTSGTATVACEVAPAGGTIPPTADVIYTAPQAGAPATLEFLDAGDCSLGPGDQVDVRAICAG